MAQEKITIKFEPSGHPQLIAAIKKLNVETKKLTGSTGAVAAATKGVSNSAKKFSGVAAGLTAKLKAQGVTWKQLGVSSETLRKAYRGSRIELERLKMAMVEANATGVLGVRNNRLLANSFATLRSQMLLVTFAMGLGGRQIIRFVKDAAKVEAMSLAFDSLSGGAGNAKIALTQLSNAAGGTMSKFDLLQASNNALILGVVKNSKEMNEMFEVAIKLGRAVGRTAKDSVDSLVTGIGRQSRMMLDNIGIIMSTEKAYASYAAELGVTVESLDDTERRQAFLSATMEAAREKASLLGDDMETMQSRIEKVTAALSDAKVALGEASISVFDLDTNLDIFTKSLNSLMKPLGDVTGSDLNLWLQNYARGVMLANPLMIQFAKAFGINVSAINLFSEATENANNELIEFNRIVKENNDKIQKKATELINATTAARMREISATIEFVNANKKLFGSEQNVLDVLAMLEEEYKALDPIEKERLQNLKDLREARKKEAKLILDVAKAQAALNKELARQEAKALQIQLKKLKDEYKLLKIEIDDNNKMHEDSMLKFKELFPTYEEFTGKLMAQAQVEEHHSENVRKFIKEYPEMAKELGLLNKEIDKSTIAGDLAEASIAALANEMARLVIEGENLAKIKPGKVIGQMVLGTIFASIAGAIASPFLTAFGLAAAVAHKGGLIKDDGKVQRFATGGTVRGGDNVPILAQGGEFIMSRNAVDSVGIENLNRMNEGGGGGAVTVNVSGNVMSQDYVEGELAEQIKEAIRRGNDFGLS